ncbi:MAG: hypothetical protein ACK5KR_02870 [Breznakia sp.]
MRKLWLMVCLSVLVACAPSAKERGVINVTFTEMIAKITGVDNTFLLMISYGNDDSCYACKGLKEEIMPVLDEQGIDLYIFDYEDIAEDEDLQSQLRVYVNDTQYSSWPILLYIKNGSVVSAYEYSLRPEEWKSWLTTYYQIP